MKDFKNIQPLANFCTTKVLPTVYTDALSYGEAQGKIIYVLNQLVENVNMLPAYIQQAIQGYITSGELEKVLTEIFSNYVLNVKYPPNGLSPAKGDGVTDDTATIQGCINIAAIKGGMVFFPSGDYMTHPLTVLSNVSIAGQGKDNTTITLLGGAANPIFTVDADNLAISNVALNANMGAQTNNVGCLKFTGNNIDIINVTIKQAYDAVSITQTTGRATISNVNFESCIHNALTTTGGSVCCSDVSADSFSSLNPLAVIVNDADDSSFTCLHISAAVPIAFKNTGNNVDVSGVIKNATTPIENTGVKVLINLQGAQFSVDTEDVRINAATAEIIATDISLRATNPLKYKQPTPLNDFFKTIPLANQLGEQYDVLVAGDNVATLGANTVINVRDFGAVGNALYYDNTAREWWTTSAKTTKPTDDGPAIQKAIDYALAHNVNTIYFPDGAYYCVNRAFNIDTSKLNFVGENVSQLISVNLPANTSFITLSSPLSLSMYDYPRVPISRLSIKGNYFVNNPSVAITSGVTGVSWATATNVVACHSAIRDVCIIGFTVGLMLEAAYKSCAINLSIIACDYGIYNKPGGAIPWHAYQTTIECCANAVYSLGSGYSTLFFLGGSFEYNRINYNGVGKVVFNDIRFEGDLYACCNNALSPLYNFNVSDSLTSQLIFTDCQFLYLRNYSDNVTYWIPASMQKISTSLPDVIIFYNSPSYQGCSGLIIENCNFASEENVVSGFIIASSGVTSIINLDNASTLALSATMNQLLTAQLSITSGTPIKFPIAPTSRIFMAKIKPSIALPYSVRAERFIGTQHGYSDILANGTAPANQWTTIKIVLPLDRGYNSLYLSPTATCTLDPASYVNIF